MKELALHLLDVAKNSVAAGATWVDIALDEDRDGRLTIVIADNGRGIPEEKLEEILWKMKNTDDETASVGQMEPERDFGVPKGSIGLPNIYRRLKLTFGGHAHLNLRSKEGYYTVAELVIPRYGGDFGHLPDRFSFR